MSRKVWDLQQVHEIRGQDRAGNPRGLQSIQLREVRSHPRWAKRAVRRWMQYLLLWLTRHRFDSAILSTTRIRPGGMHRQPRGADLAARERRLRLHSMRDSHGLGQQSGTRRPSPGASGSTSRNPTSGWSWGRGQATGTVNEAGGTGKNTGPYPGVQKTTRATRTKTGGCGMVVRESLDGHGAPKLRTVSCAGNEGITKRDQMGGCCIVGM